MIRTPKQYTAYFKALSENHKAINGFYRIAYNNNMEQGDMLFLQDFLDKINNIQTPCMLSVLPDGKIEDNTSENYLGYNSGAFLVLDRAKRNDFDKQEDIYEQTFIWATQIIAYFKRDMKMNKTGWVDIQLGDFDYSYIGPFKNEFFGVMITFRYKVVLNEMVVYDFTDKTVWNTPL